MTLAFAGTANAQVIGVDFEGDIQPNDLDLTDQITVSTWTQGTGGNPAGINNTDTGAQTGNAFDGTTTGRLQSDTTPTFFTLTFGAGEEWDLDSISWAYRAATTSGAVRTMSLAASINGNTPISLYSSPGGAPNRNAAPNMADGVLPNINFSSAFEGLSNGDTVRFDWSTSGAVDIDGIQINATLIPKPSSAILLGIAGTMLLLRRRSW